MMKVSYHVSAAGWSVDSAADPRTELIALETFSALGSPRGGCRLALHAPPAPKPGLLEAAVGAAMGAVGLGGNGPAQPPAFAVDVRGQAIQPGDPMTITLTAGDVTAKVLTAEVHTIRSTFGRTTIEGRTALTRLAATRLNQVYENQSVDSILNDLCSQAGVAAGSIDPGSTLPYLVVHESRSLLQHVLDLAGREGLNVFVDPSNQLNVGAFQKTQGDHVLYYGIDLLDLRLRHAPIGDEHEHLFVFGEGAASQRGADAWSWAVKDQGPYHGEAGQGRRRSSRRDGAIRTKDAADRFAAAWLGRRKDQGAAGWLTIVGNPNVKPADALELKNVPEPALNGLFQVVAVRHVLSKRHGYQTHVAFTGQGGAAQAGGLLGQLGGQLAGAVGL